MSSAYVSKIVTSVTSTIGHFGIGHFENEKFRNRLKVPVSLFNYHAVGISNLRYRQLKNSKLMIIQIITILVEISS